MSSKGLLYENTPEAASARLEAMKGKQMLMLSAGRMLAKEAPDVGQGTKDYCRWALDNGVVTTYVVDKDGDNLEKVYRDQKLCTKFLPVDYTNAQTIAADIKKTGITYDGVFNHVEQMQPLVGEVGEELGIACNPAQAYRIARLKFEARKSLAAAGLRTPRSFAISTVDDVPKAAAEVKFPLIVKPTSGAGSGGVYRANNEEELKELVTKSLADLAANHMLGYNPGMTGDEAPLVAEQFLQPKMFPGLPVFEYDIDVLMFDGEAVYVQVVDNWIPSPTYYLETGSNFPSMVPQDVQKELGEFSVACAKAMGFNRGAFHIECIYTEEGAQLIEVNPRVGGGSDQAFHKGVMKVNLMENFFMALLNIPINPVVPEKPYKMMLDYGVNSPVTGLLKDMECFKEAEGHKYTTSVDKTCAIGQKVAGFDKSFPDTVAMIEWTTPEVDIKVVQELLEIGERCMNNIKVDPIEEKAATPDRKMSVEGEAAARRASSRRESQVLTTE